MEREKVKVKITSFGFKYGVVPEANYVWDVRFLPNPFWVEELKHKTGKQRDVSDYVIGSPAGHDFIKMMKPMLLYLVQQNIQAGKKELTIGIGCTGGKHRSVAVVEVLTDILSMLPVELECAHRDIENELG